MLNRRTALLISLPVASVVLSLLIYASLTNSVRAWVLLSLLGSKYVTVLTSFLLVVFDPEVALVAMSCTLTSGCVAVILKFLLKLPRPPPSLWRIKVSGYGFPSGHATMSSSAYGFVALYLKYPCIVATCGLVMFAVALSRVMLGVHYVRDVAGGIAIGLGLALLMYYLYERCRGPVPSLVLAIILGMISYIYSGYGSCIEAAAVAAGLLTSHVMFKKFYHNVRSALLKTKVLYVLATIFAILAVLGATHSYVLSIRTVAHYFCGFLMIAVPCAIASVPQLLHH